MNRTVKKKASKSTTVNTRYALVETKKFKSKKNDRISYPITDLKTSPQHALNSFLLHGEAKNVNKMSIVKIEIIGTPEVKVTRNIKFKK